MIGKITASTLYEYQLSDNKMASTDIESYRVVVVVDDDDVIYIYIYIYI
jgi:hypothetical protein